MIYTLSKNEQRLSGTSNPAILRFQSPDTVLLQKDHLSSRKKQFPLGFEKKKFTTILSTFETIKWANKRKYEKYFGREHFNSKIFQI